MTGARVWSYARGDWLGVFGPRVTVLLPPAERARAAATWERVDAGADFEEALDAVVAPGLRDLPAFVLVGEEQGAIRAVVRGSARVRLTTAGGEVDVEGEPALTWVERRVPGVTRVRIEVAGAPEDGFGQLAAGLVRVAGAEWPAARQGAPVETMPVAAQVAADHDGLTRHPTAEPAPPPAPSVTVCPVARLVLPDGETVAVDRAVLLGRAPEPARATTADAPRLVAVDSPHQEVSATHLEIRPGSGVDQGAAVATDLGSTNGTVVVQPGLPPEDLRPGVTVQLVPGALVDLGDGVSIRVVGA